MLRERTGTPIVCFIDGIFGNCEDCDQEAGNIADKGNPLDDLEGLLPSVGDISGSDWVGMWHHIKVSVPASNEFDNHQGLLFEEAGPPGPPDPLALTLMAVFDASGLSVNHGESQGTQRYQIANAARRGESLRKRLSGGGSFLTGVLHTPATTPTFRCEVW